MCEQKGGGIAIPSAETWGEITIPLLVEWAFPSFHLGIGPKSECPVLLSQKHH